MFSNIKHVVQDYEMLFDDLDTKCRIFQHSIKFQKNLIENYGEECFFNITEKDKHNVIVSVENIFENFSEFLKTIVTIFTTMKGNLIELNSVVSSLNIKDKDIENIEINVYPKKDLLELLTKFKKIMSLFSPLLIKYKELAKDRKTLLPDDDKTKVQLEKLNNEMLKLSLEFDKNIVTHKSFIPEKGTIKSLGYDSTSIKTITTSILKFTEHEISRCSNLIMSNVVKITNPIDVTLMFPLLFMKCARIEQKTIRAYVKAGKEFINTWINVVQKVVKFVQND
jgi:hypothetical protein